MAKGNKHARRRDGFGVALIWGLLGLVSRLPLRWHLGIFRLVSWFLEKVMHYRRDELMINLSRSFPEKKYKELKQIRHKVYVHLGDLMAEAVRFSRFRGRKGPARLHREHIIEVLNVAEMNRLFDASPSIMLLCGHSGNWELLPGLLNMNYDEANPWHVPAGALSFVYKELHSRLWDRIIARNRISVLRAQDPAYDAYQETNHILRYALEHRGDKKVYVFPSDQYPYRGAVGHDIGTFMHQPTKAMTGGAALAAKLGMAVVYTRWSIVERGRYTIEFIPLTENAKGADPVEIMKKYYACLEEDLQRQPEIYLWTHKRWK